VFRYGGYSAWYEYGRGLDRIRGTVHSAAYPFIRPNIALRLCPLNNLRYTACISIISGCRTIRDPLDDMFKFLRKLLGRSGRFPAETDPGLDPEMFIYVMIPGDIQPLMRGEQFEDPLTEVLEVVGVGNLWWGLSAWQAIS